MKVLQIINSLGTGGAEKLLLDTLPLYRDAGIEMDILLFWNNNHQFVKALRELDCCNIYILNESLDISDVYKLINIIRLKSILKNYDIAHVHLFPAQYFAVLANLLNLNSCKLIFTEHNTTNGRINKKYLKPVEWFIYKNYTKIISISFEIEAVLKSYLGNIDNFFEVINNGVNLSVIENASAYTPDTIDSELNITDILIIQISAFRKQKDQPTLIRAIGLIPNEKVKLLLVGDGEERVFCEELVNNLKLNSRVFFLGQRMDVPNLIKSAHIIVLSSGYEGLSLSSIEGMASGKPFVASNVPGLRDVVSGAGILFECGNETELASKIVELITDQDYYNKIVNSCQLRAKGFDISVMVGKHIALYKSVYEA